MDVSRLLYISKRVLSSIGSLASQTANALFLEGSTYQSVSARSYVESHYDPVWEERRNTIDTAFRYIPVFGSNDHCKEAWQFEVDRAKKTLLRNHIYTSQGTEIDRSLEAILTDRYDVIIVEKENA